ncbi:MAG TPA: hypothetical protein DDY78_20885 [Planctomycetales bacterium]|nr:hypothetical protein [Planctomycetales bacterium]
MTFNNRGNVLFDKWDYDKAVADYTEAVRLAPKFAVALSNRGAIWRVKKEYAQALADFDEALRINPKYPAPLNLRARILAACPKEQFRDGKRAIEDARLACELTKDQETTYLDTLAAAYAETGDFDAAVKWQTKVVASPRSSPMQIEDARKRLKLYQDQKPYRDE